MKLAQAILTKHATHQLGLKHAMSKGLLLISLAHGILSRPTTYHIFSHGIDNDSESSIKRVIDQVALAVLSKTATYQADLSHIYYS
jgi:hypothetical protein